MSRVALRLLACSLACGVPAAGASAQSSTSPTGVAPPYHVALVEGSVTLTRSGDVFVVAPGEPVVDGDRLQSPGGRVELRGPDGERVFVDQGSVFDVLQPPVFRLVAGAVRVVLDAPARADGAPVVEVDTPHATAALFEPGDYRLSVLQRTGGEETELIVRAGRGEVINMYGRVPVTMLQRVAASAFTAPSSPETLAAADLRDSFDRWVDQTLAGTAPTASAAYLPSGLESYSAALDTAGSWSYEPTYGHVWYPTVVASWQPYYQGYWRPLGYYGYTWVSHNPWAWATHHYGRWEFGISGWFWIPGTAWASAWVSWGVGPGYVAWCPLGWGNRPVYAAPFGRYYGRPARYPKHAGRGWTVVRAEHFRTSAPVSRHAMNWNSLGSTEQRAFVQQQTPPRVHLAVPRGSLAAARARNAEARQGGVRTFESVPTGRAAPTATRTLATAPEPRRTPASAGRPQWASPAGEGGSLASRRAPFRSGDTPVRGTAEYPTSPGRAYTRVPERLPGAGARSAAESRRPASGAVISGSSESGRSAPVARPRWTPPTTRYGIPPADTNRRLAAPPAPERSGAGVARTEPRSARPEGASRVYRPSPSPRSGPPAVQRGSPAGAARAPATRAPAVRRAPSRAPGGSAPPAVGRPAGGAGPPRGQATPRGGAPRRPGR